MPIEQPQLGPSVVRNISLSGGINQRLNGRILAEDEAVDITNGDISTPGRRTKRLDPLDVHDLASAPAAYGPASIIWGMFPYNLNGTSYILTASVGKIWLVTGLNSLGPPATIAGPTIATNGFVIFTQANGVIYVLDSSGNLFSIDALLTIITPIVILDATNTAIIGIQDMIWFQNQMWYVAGSFLYFSVVNQPTTITQSAINVAVGDGGVLRRVLPYRNGLLILFKFGMNGGQGSIHLCDVSSGQPALFQLNTTPFFDHLNLCSPRCVNRMGFDQNAEVVFATIEGLRTDAFTALDRLVTPSLPFSQNIPNAIEGINGAALDAASTIFWNDELLWMVPLNGVNIPPDFTTNPNPVVNFATAMFAYTTKIPKQNVLNGWTIIENNPATVAVIAAFNGNPPALYIGTPGGYSTVGPSVQQAFAAIAKLDSASTYSETGKRNDHGMPFNEKIGRRLLVSLDTSHRGTINVNMNFDDGTTESVGSYTPTGTMFPLKFPTSFTFNQEFKVPFDLHFADLGSNYKRYYDAEINVTSTEAPAILGTELNAVIYDTRYQELNTPIPAFDSTPASIAPETVTPAPIAFE